MEPNEVPTTQEATSAEGGKLLICPYCGDTQPVLFTEEGVQSERCRSCAGLFEPLSRQATHNSMGPWFVRDVRRPFQPGCSYETLARLVQRGKVTKHTIVRGPTTRQFWTIASRVPGIAHLLGCCHACDASVDAGDHGCHACGASFGAFLDRNFLGLPEYRPLPWEQPVQSEHDAAAFIGDSSRDPSARTWHYGLPAIRERDAEPRNLSSFATDEELRSEEPLNVVTPPSPIVQQSGSRNLDVEFRVLRRRAARQERIIRRLTIMAMVAGVCTLFALIGWISLALSRVG